MKYNQPYNDCQNYYWFNEGFSKEELNRIYEGVSNLPFKKAIIIGESEETTSSEIRSSSIKWIPKTNEWLWVYKKLMDLSTEANKIWGFDLISADEEIQYTEYYDKNEGHYDWHQDIGPGSPSHRKVSITVQLSDSDEYEGGDLQIWSGGQNIQNAARGAGVVVIFPSYMMHRVTKVTKGTRRSFVLWVGGSHYK
jgi:PKHD-type hydroxylase